MPLDPARVLSAYLRAQVYRAPEPDPEHASAGGAQTPAAAPNPPAPSNPSNAPNPSAPEDLPRTALSADPDAEKPPPAPGPAAPRGAPRRPGLFARLLLYVRQE
ncbi:hypothetical protein ACFY97_00570 [Streptomyces klenkii]|uniref:hypothetical protein n=1 Tax=Streptomyces klenkii TaxID=1420899 RepID=UPI0036EC9D9C